MKKSAGRKLRRQGVAGLNKERRPLIVRASTEPLPEKLRKKPLLEQFGFSRGRAGTTPASMVEPVSAAPDFLKGVKFVSMLSRLWRKKAPSTITDEMIAKDMKQFDGELKNIIRATYLAKTFQKREQMRAYTLSKWTENFCASLGSLPKGDVKRYLKAFRSHHGENFLELQKLLGLTEADMAQVEHDITFKLKL